jgi:hypothetical protein
MKQIALHILFFTVLIASPVYAQDTLDEKDYTPKYIKESKILFPCSRDWTPITAMKKADFASVKSLLVNAVNENKNCDKRDIASRVLERQDTGYYEFDVDHDGRPDIIYAGEIPGEEFKSSVVWYKTTGGYRIDESSTEGGMLLSVSDSAQHQFMSVYTPCCANIIENFCMQTIEKKAGNNIRTHDSTCAIFTGQELPKRSMKPVRFTSVAKEMILRSGTRIDNVYDTTFSMFSNMAAFGNIDSKYMPGTKGVVLGRKTDKRGRLWYFVYLDKNSQALRTYTLENVDAGWVLAKDIRLEK